MKKILTIIFILMIKNSIAQYKSVPGFMGVRNCVSLGTKHHVIFIDENFIQNLVFQPSIELSFDRAINRRSTIGLTYGNHSFTINGNSGLSKFATGSRLLIDVDNKEAEFKFTNNGNTSFKNNYFTVYKTYFMKKRGAIAPMGKFFKMGITANFFKIKEDNNDYSYQDPNTRKLTYYKNTETKWNTFEYYVANFELGSRNFITNNVYFNHSVGLNFPVNFYYTSQKYSYNNVSDYNEAFVKWYFSRMQSFNLNFSLGYAF